MIKINRNQAALIYKNAGRQILELRQELGYTRKELAEAVGITEKFLYEIEYGRKGFSALNLYYISCALQVDAGCFFQFRNQMQESE